MEIELYKEYIDDKAKPGDIIQFNNTEITAIVGKNYPFLLEYSYGEDWMIAAAEGYFDEFKKGNYKILAKSSEWQITWK